MDTVAMRPAAEKSFTEPDTTGEAVLAWLEDQQYRETWELWPATAPLHAEVAQNAEVAQHAGPTPTARSSPRTQTPPRSKR